MYNVLRFVVASTYHTRTTYMWQTIQRKALLPAQGTVVKTAKCSARPQTPCRNSTKVEQCSITTAYTVGKLFLIANASSHRMLSSRRIRARSDEYYLLVVCDGEGCIVGTGSLVVERKFIHSLGMVGHIEDIAVEKGQQGKKLGLRIIQALDYVAEKVGCYKVCSVFCFLFGACRVGDWG